MSYFDDAAAQHASGGTYARIDELPLVDAGSGVTLRPLSGERLLLSYVHIAPHGLAAVHTHDEEQIGLVVQGRCEFELDGEVRQLGPGDAYHAPPGVPHGARTGDEECVIVDMFAPPRRALLERMR
jgi:quercetin dioxygenase-like cupin family protein